MLRTCYLFAVLTFFVLSLSPINALALDSDRVQEEARAAEQLGKEASEAFEEAERLEAIKKQKEQALNEARRAADALVPECRSDHCIEVRRALQEAQDAFNQAQQEFNRAKRLANDLENRAKRAAAAVREELDEVKNRGKEMAALKDLSDLDGGSIAKAMVLINTLNSMGKASDARKLSLMLAEAIVFTGPAAAAEVAQAMGDVFSEVESEARKQAKQLENDIRRAEKHGRAGAEQSSEAARAANEELLGIIQQMR